LRCEGDASRPRADRGGERQKTAQRRLKPSAYAYRRKQGCGDKEREVQNTYHARKDARRNRFCAAPAAPILSEAGHQSIVPGEEKKQSGFNLAWLLAVVKSGNNLAILPICPS
jgi:hypothetical protein